MKITENRLLTLITESINEAINNILLEREREYTENNDPLAWEYFFEYGPEYVFKTFKDNPHQNNMWGPLINPHEYAKALDEFVQNGELIRYPTQRIYQWMGICLKNIALLKACTEIYDHSQWFPEDEFIDIFFDYDEDAWEEYCQENGLNPDEYYTYLENIGFIDWCDGGTDTIACTDYGLEPLMKLACEYTEGLSPEKTMILINRILDVVHRNGDLSSLFMQGGKSACDAISNGRGKLSKETYYGPF